MRIILKILAVPFALALTVSWAVMVFLFSWASTLLSIASGLAVLVSIALFITRVPTGGIVLLTIAFLISPAGIPLIANWLISKLGDLTAALRCFIAS